MLEMCFPVQLDSWCERREASRLHITSLLCSSVFLAQSAEAGAAVAEVPLMCATAARFALTFCPVHPKPALWGFRLLDCAGLPSGQLSIWFFSATIMGR